MFHWDNRPPSSQGEQQPPHRCYIKCPLAVIPLGHRITGPGSSYEPVGQEEGRCPSSCGFTNTHICSRSTEDAQMATEETATREWRESVCWRLPLTWQQPVEPSIRCWQRPPPQFHSAVVTQNSDSVSGWMRNITQRETQTFKTSL